MTKNHWIAFTLALSLTASGAACAQSYPTKSIRIVTSAPGGANDLTTRIIAQGIAPLLGQPVVVDNRGSVLTGEIVAKAPPDGYTILAQATSFTMGPLLGDAPYDIIRDFAPISLATKAPNILTVHPSVQVSTVAELITLAKAKPGALNFATGNTGSSAHLAGELFKAMSGVNIVRIPYKGDGPAIIGLLGGQTQLMFVTAGSVIPHVKSGKLKAIAVTSLQRSAVVPELPSISESGLNGYESSSAVVLFAPAKTPANVINRLNQDIVRFLNQPDTKQKFLAEGAADVIASSPRELAAWLKFEMSRWGKVIKDAGIRNSN
jgi:tripartite-type tricarboxylate transporter receptor subunit TctC